MTWLPDLPDGGNDWEQLTALSPDGFSALAALVATAWRSTDPALLELARLRIATLLGNAAELERRTPEASAAGVTEEHLAALPDWSRSPLFTEAERACLALVEQFVMDASGVSDDQVAAVTEHLGAAGCYAFVEAVSVLETFQRACLTLGIASFPEVLA